LEDMVDGIVHELETGGSEVPSSVIGARVLEKLREIDEVAYLRYASVYQRFQDVDQFVDAIHTLGRRIKPNALQRELFPSDTMKENANVARRSGERAIKDHGRV
jgi:transcriptional repressor NrdR